MSTVSVVAKQLKKMEEGEKDRCGYGHRQTTRGERGRKEREGPMRLEKGVTLSTKVRERQS